MIKVDGVPRFNSISLGSLSINRIDQPGDRVSAKFALIDSGSRQTLGWTQLEGLVLMGSRSKELLSQLVESLEHDASRILYVTDQQGKEEAHVSEPKGLADEVEEATQI